MPQTNRRFPWAMPMLATIAFALTIPFNMGGCADVMSAAGKSIGGPTGQYLDSGGQAMAGLDINEKDDRALGESVAMMITTVHPVSKNVKLNQYVTLVGLTLANASSRPDGNWIFGVVEADEANAFSGPGGFIMVTTGLLKQLHDESELAGVLAHEVTHVLKAHGREAVKRAKVAGAAVSAMQADKNLAKFAQGTDGMVDMVVIKGYGRTEEEEADAGAVPLLIAAGYDPHGFVNFLDRVAKAQGTAGNTLMKTHPGAAERASKVRNLIASQKMSGPGATLQDRYQANVLVTP